MPKGYIAVQQDQTVDVKQMVNRYRRIALDFYHCIMFITIYALQTCADRLSSFYLAPIFVHKRQGCQVGLT